MKYLRRKGAKAHEIFPFTEGLYARGDMESVPEAEALKLLGLVAAVVVAPVAVAAVEAPVEEAPVEAPVEVAASIIIDEPLDIIGGAVIIEDEPAATETPKTKTPKAK